MIDALRSVECCLPRLFGLIDKTRHQKHARQSCPNHYAVIVMKPYQVTLAARNVEVNHAIETAAGFRLVAFIVHCAPEEAITSCYVDWIVRAACCPQELFGQVSRCADLAVIEAINPQRPK